MGKKRGAKWRRGVGAERSRHAMFRRIIIVGFGLVLGLVALVICCAALS